MPNVRPKTKAKTRAWAAGGHAPPNPAAIKRMREINAERFVKAMGGTHKDGTHKSNLELEQMRDGFGDYAPTLAQINVAIKKLIR